MGKVIKINSTFLVLRKRGNDSTISCYYSKKGYENRQCVLLPNSEKRKVDMTVFVAVFGEKQNIIMHFFILDR